MAARPATSASYDEELEECAVELARFNVGALKHAVRDAEQPELYIRVGAHYNMCFKMLRSDSRLVKALLFSYGFTQVSAKNPNFNLFWSNTHLTAHSMRSLKPWQRVNHFPRSYLITKKDELNLQLCRARAQYGRGFDFNPESYGTPMSVERREALKAIIAQHASEGTASYILKPSNSSRGRGIAFITHPDQIDEIDDSDKTLISRYISNPYLVQNKKCDLRIYVAVTSFYPLMAYIYTEGLARFAVEDYSEAVDTEAAAAAHLTNYSLHKGSDKFVKNTETDSESIGHKWTLGALLRELEADGVDIGLLMARIEDIVVKTLLSVQRVIAAACRKLTLNARTCFELFGFDILIDDTLKPWLLEVNLSPSLVCDAPLDSILKSSLMCDTLNLICMPLVSFNNGLNKSFILTQSKSKTVDDIISGVSSTSVAAKCDAGQSASQSPATVDSGYDSLAPTIDTDTASTSSLANSKAATRRRLPIRAAKIKRAQSHVKIRYSADVINEQYQARLDIYAQKIREEGARLGNFVRVFPRAESMALYSDICEDTGAEQWDASLHKTLYADEVVATRQEHSTFHEQMMNTKQAPRREDLEPTTQRLLATSLTDVQKYWAPFYENDDDPYPKLVPKLRYGLRKRTLSQIDFDLRRRAEVCARRANGTSDAELKAQLYEQYLQEMGYPLCMNP